MDKIVGKAAPGDFIEKLEELANAHHDDLELDVIRAYFFGARFIVEVPRCPFSEYNVTPNAADILFSAHVKLFL